MAFDNLLGCAGAVLIHCNCQGTRFYKAMPNPAIAGIECKRDADIVEIDPAARCRAVMAGFKRDRVAP